MIKDEQLRESGSILTGVVYTTEGCVSIQTLKTLGGDVATVSPEAQRYYRRCLAAANARDRASEWSHS